MNFLLDFTTTNFKYAHQLAILLKEKYPNAKFAGFLGIALHEKNAITFLETQKDIPYEFLVQFSSLHDPNAKTTNFALMKEFEEESSEKSLWRMIVADKNLGSSFLHNCIEMETIENLKGLNRDEILKKFSSTLTNLNHYFTIFKPNFYLAKAALGNITTLIIEELCKKHNAQYIFPVTLRLNNYFGFTNTTQMLFPEIEESYKAAYQKNVEFSSEVNDLYNHNFSDLSKSDYFDRTYDWLKVSLTSPLKCKVLLFVGLIKSTLTVSYQWLLQTPVRFSNDPRRQPKGLNSILTWLEYAYAQHWQRYQLLNKDFYKKEIKKEDKYVYFPLHINPEYSTQVLGKLWLDQTFLIELIAKSLPFDWILLVKEHPATLKVRARPFGFYKNILKIPNVKIAPVNMEMNEIISNSQMVMTISGTAGWEAIMRGKPVITFAKNFYDFMGLSNKCNDIENLPSLIKKVMKENDLITKDERAKRFKYFIHATLEKGFNVTYPIELNGDRVADVEQSENIANEIFTELCKRIDRK